MKYALYTGCVAKGAGKELMVSTEIAARALGISLVEMKDASCCGAGVIHEDNPMLADALNARTFSIAEEMGLDIMTICSTCQGVMKHVQHKFAEKPSYKEKVNKELVKDTGRTYEGKVKIRQFYQIVDEEYGIDKMAEKATKSLKGLKIAPYYGCYALRPHETMDTKVPDKTSVLEKTITALGAEVVEFDASQKCCGFPILMPNKSNSLRLAGNVLESAKKAGADFIVTPCPLCHLNLDAYQGEAESMFGLSLGVPILHYSQMVALALGASAKDLRLANHIVKADHIAEKIPA
ncbi:MAG: CoB--CoM heterodisulfide reductase iron-sulfur subunit B family protein [Nitrospinota bacterium]|nr:CoB--CoM heterodisulfide reductase iron-sulfur subunit B family protein [Nitrospinota bacterium]